MLFCFSWLKDSIFETLVQKLFSFPGYSNFIIVECQILWRHQIPKDETKNISYWIACEVNTIRWWNLASLCDISYKSFYKRRGLETSSKTFLIFKESSIKTSLRKSASWFWLILIVLLLHMQYNQLVSEISYSIRDYVQFFINKNGPETSFQVEVLKFFIFFNIT